jgi:uncharacterized Tic20 family protein
MSQTVPSSRADEPPAQLLDRSERLTAVLIWLVDIPVGLLGPAFLWWFMRADSKFVDHHGKACLNHAGTLITILFVVAVIFGVPTIVFCLIFDKEQYPLLTVVLLAISGGVILLAMLLLLPLTLIIHLIAAYKAWKGAWYTPPLCWRVFRFKEGPR